MLQLTARFADGWNSAWFGADPSPFRDRLSALWAALDECGRPRDSIEVSAGILVLPGPQDQRTSSLVLCGDSDQIAAGLRAYEEAGAQHVVLSLGTAPFRLQDPSFIESVAKAIGILAS
jgi:alkanesulfonate monooxygenase SsuD/methylene tetrahydromethanopterin reductase-like flavin-dependent oxidoreductase (luciferase family)